MGEYETAEQGADDTTGPAKPDHTAIAFGRSCGGRTLVTNDRVEGMISAAPTPMRHRNASSTFGLGAWLEHRSEAEDDEPDL